MSDDAGVRRRGRRRSRAATSAATLGEILLSVVGGMDDDVVALAGRTLTDLGEPGGRTDGDESRPLASPSTWPSIGCVSGIPTAAPASGADPAGGRSGRSGHRSRLQAYRLARWRVAADELDYRRFLDVNSLVALRTEDAEVFDATHRLIGGLVRDGSVDGLRVDHVDGMADPADYCVRLRASAPGAWL